MDILDKNAMEDLALKVTTCSKQFWYLCPSYCIIIAVDSPLQSLTKVLTACSKEFYKACSDFHRVPCDFGPVIEATKFWEQEVLARIAELEAKVQELELKKR